MDQFRTLVPDLYYDKLLRNQKTWVGWRVGSLLFLSLKPMVHIGLSMDTLNASYKLVSLVSTVEYAIVD